MAAISIDLLPLVTQAVMIIFIVTYTAIPVKN